MIKTTDKDIDHVADLSGLTLTDEEKETYKEQLSSVIFYINEIQSVDTTGTEPTSQTTGIENALRNDTSQGTSLSQDEATSGTEDVYSGYISVPMILKERTV